VHAGFEQSRRDDLESVGYLLIYFALSKLPWMGLKGRTKEEKYAAIYAKKQSITNEMLCAGLPSEFVSYFKYVRALKFNETPNYKAIRHLFKVLFMTKGYVVLF
jgi:hypothetical protein